MVSCRCFLAYMQTLHPCLVDFVPFHSHCFSPVTTPECQPCLSSLYGATDISLPLPSFPVLISSYQAKHPAGKDTFAPLNYVDPLSPKKVLILKQGSLTIETKPSQQQIVKIFNPFPSQAGVRRTPPGSYSSDHHPYNSVLTFYNAKVVPGCITHAHMGEEQGEIESGASFSSFSTTPQIHTLECSKILWRTDQVGRWVL